MHNSVTVCHQPPIPKRIALIPTLVLSGLTVLGVPITTAVADSSNSSVLLGLGLAALLAYRGQAKKLAYSRVRV